MLSNYNRLYTQIPYFQWLKCNWLNKYNHDYMIIFDLRILGNDWLKSELLDITGDWVSSSGMHCQAFTAADFSCCLWVFLPLVLSSARSSNEEFSTFTFKNFWLAFGVCFGSSSSCTIKRRPINCCIWLNLGREYFSTHFRFHPAASVFCLIITKHQ